MRKKVLAVLALALVVAVSWPLAVYITYTIPSESAEAIVEVSDVFMPGRPPGFVGGVGSLATLRESGFKASGVFTLANHHIGVFRLKDSGVVLVLFMPVYRDVNSGSELSGEELARLVNNTTASLNGYLFVSRRGAALVPVEVVVDGRRYVAVAHGRHP